MSNLQAMIDEALDLALKASASTKEIKGAIRAALERLLPVGTVIDLGQPKKTLPEYLGRVDTISGKDHGTRKFRIERIGEIRFDPRRPELTQWEADATPISEKTGNDMNGRVAHAMNARRGNVVGLLGNIVADRGPDDRIEDQLDRMIKLLAADGAVSSDVSTTETYEDCT